jgi:hypothetical protein
LFSEPPISSSGSARCPVPSVVCEAIEKAVSLGLSQEPAESARHRPEYYVSHLLLTSAIPHPRFMCRYPVHHHCRLRAPVSIQAPPTKPGDPTCWFNPANRDGACHPRDACLALGVTWQRLTCVMFPPTWCHQGSSLTWLPRRTRTEQARISYRGSIFSGRRAPTKI